ncbi:MAG: tetratricopeptide repeat protein [Candidatus Edwardsbacteria bacterium]|nr:tetratricopeptide repeat protein [Candidatus Edwardsbacteria bacterium]
MLTASLVFIALTLTPAESFNQGNQFYARNDYPAAIEAYMQALKGAPNPVVHYNLGNAFFKSGQIGRAILEYQRARLLDPRDNDIRTNLRFVRSYRVDKNLSVPGPIADLLDGVFHWLSYREAALLAALGIGLGALLVSLFIALRRRFLLYAAIIAFLPFLYGSIAAGVWQSFRGSKPAVVIVPEVSALSGPGEDYKDIVLIHDGSEVSIRETRGDWLLVQLPGGVGGWVKRDALGRIF